MDTSFIRPVVVIPVYKQLSHWDRSEFVSLNRCLKVLGNHPIFIVGPKGLDWEDIENYLATICDKKVNTILLEDFYFKNIEGYNRLLKSRFFYEHFISFSHLLIYQLDAYVFKDELEYWCSKNFDYIGAPWVEKVNGKSSVNLVGVGNGGFSLHNIPNAIKILKKVKFILKILELTEKSILYKKVSRLKWISRYFLLKLCFKIKDQRYISGLSLLNDIYEDKFWSIYIPTTFNSFKVASVEEAVKFSFEVSPCSLYEINDKNLPFGCHAWERYDPMFWKRFIDTSAFIEYKSKYEE